MACTISITSVIGTIPDGHVVADRNRGGRHRVRMRHRTHQGHGQLRYANFSRSARRCHGRMDRDVRNRRRLPAHEAHLGEGCLHGRPLRSLVRGAAAVQGRRGRVPRDRDADRHGRRMRRRPGRHRHRYLHGHPHLLGPGCTFVWHFGDGSPDVTTSVPAVTHVYAMPGSFSAIATANCPPVGGHPCTSRALGNGRRTTMQPCPTVVGLTPVVSGCAGPGVATVTFTGTLTPPIAGCTFLWSFGDGSPSLLTTTPSATMSTHPGDVRRSRHADLSEHSAMLDGHDCRRGQTLLSDRHEHHVQPRGQRVRQRHGYVGNDDLHRRHGSHTRRRYLHVELRRRLAARHESRIECDARLRGAGHLHGLGRVHAESRDVPGMSRRRRSPSRRSRFRPAREAVGEEATTVAEAGKAASASAHVS